MCRTERGASGYGTVEKDCGNALRSEIQCGGFQMAEGWFRHRCESVEERWKPRAMFGRARFVPLSPACQRPKLVPVICNASNIYCRGLLGIDRADTVTGRQMKGVSRVCWRREKTTGAVKAMGWWRRKGGRGRRHYWRLSLGVKARTEWTAWGRWLERNVKMMIRHEKGRKKCRGKAASRQRYRYRDQRKTGR